MLSKVHGIWDAHCTFSATMVVSFLKVVSLWENLSSINKKAYSSKMNKI